MDHHEFLGIGRRLDVLHFTRTELREGATGIDPRERKVERRDHCARGGVELGDVGNGGAVEPFEGAADEQSAIRGHIDRVDGRGAVRNERRVDDAGQRVDAKQLVARHTIDLIETAAHVHVRAVGVGVQGEHLAVEHRSEARHEVAGGPIEGQQVATRDRRAIGQFDLMEVAAHHEHVADLGGGVDLSLQRIDAIEGVVGILEVGRRTENRGPSGGRRLRHHEPVRDVDTGVRARIVRIGGVRHQRNRGQRQHECAHSDAKSSHHHRILRFDDGPT